MNLDLIYPSKGKYYKHKVNIEVNGDTLEFQFAYNLYLKDEIKAMDGARWSPEKKIWTAKSSPRNLFQLSYLAGQNPYERYDLPLIEFTPKRTLYAHQGEMSAHILTRKQCICAVDTGLGKTLSAIEAIEELIKVVKEIGTDNWWWVGPRSALYAVQLEFMKWKTQLRPRFLSYEQLVKLLEQGGQDTPQIVVFDEAQKVKTPTSQRAQAAYFLAENVRKKWKDDAFVILMSGTPAPKSPLDWFWLAEIACPGFIREGNINKFRQRLALMEKMETGYGVFPKLITWWDDERKCAKCGKLEADHDFLHDQHIWTPSVNEVAKLYERLKGLTLVKLKKDCIDIPDKIYEVIKIKPSKQTLRLADLLEAKADRTITKLTWFRELSDGFIYKDTETKETVKCPSCKGEGIVICSSCNGTGETIDEETNQKINCYSCNGNKKETCYQCGGKKQIPKWVRETQEVASPKETVLEELLDLYEEYGRVVIYAAFTGSIEKCIKLVSKNNWNYIRADGHGWNSNLVGSPTELIYRFQEGDKDEKIAFIGQPGAAGTGLTLTASPVIIYYSNDFNAANRMQSEDRIHRIGSKGAKIIDLIHLPTDEYVLENLKKKRKLQDLTMGEMNNYLKNVDTSDWREV